MKVARFLDWLIYIPLDHGKTKCCGCDSEPPPAWAFFPCENGRGCNGCAANAGPVYQVKAAGATTTSQVVATAYPPTATPKPAAQPIPVSPSSPRQVAATMPVLDPKQFRQPAGNGN